MILNVALQVEREIGADTEDINLYPKKRKATKLNPDSSVSNYRFYMVSDYKLFQPKIIINGFELFELQLDEVNHNLYIYKTRAISKNEFLGFNLGIFEIKLSFDSEIIQLTTIVNKLGKIKEQRVQYMYESVADSDFFSLYISKFNRANNQAEEDPNNNNKYVWLVIATAHEFLNEMKRFIHGELLFTNRVTKKCFLRKYIPSLKIDSQGIDWLTNNPNELLLSADGEVHLSGFKYSINNIKSSDMMEDFNTYENRLLASTLFSIKSNLYDLSDDYSDTRLFPHKTVTKLIDTASDYLSYIQKKIGLMPPYDALPEYSNKYLNDFRYVKIFESIIRWFSENNVKYGNSIRTSILGLTKIFEHYCFIIMIESFKELGYSVSDLTFKNTEEANEVKLIKDNEIINLYYEPYIYTSTEHPIITSKKIGHYSPDFVFTYNSGNKIINGVIDAKFAEKTIIESKLGPEIYYKYGLFSHAKDTSTLDFVLAMSPSLNDDSEFQNARGEMFIKQPKPLLGLFTVPFSQSAVPQIANIFKNIIFNL